FRSSVSQSADSSEFVNVYVPDPSCEATHPVATFSATLATTVTIATTAITGIQIARYFLLDMRALTAAAPAADRAFTSRFSFGAVKRDGMDRSGVLLGDLRDVAVLIDLPGLAGGLGLGFDHVLAAIDVDRSGHLRGRIGLDEWHHEDAVLLGRLGDVAGEHDLGPVRVLGQCVLDGLAGGLQIFCDIDLVGLRLRRATGTGAVASTGGQPEGAGHRDQRGQSARAELVRVHVISPVILQSCFGSWPADRSAGHDPVKVVRLSGDHSGVV